MKKWLFALFATIASASVIFFIWEQWKIGLDAVVSGFAVSIVLPIVAVSLYSYLEKEKNDFVISRNSKKLNTDKATSNQKKKQKTTPKSKKLQKEAASEPVDLVIKMALGGSIPARSSLLRIAENGNGKAIMTAIIMAERGDILARSSVLRMAEDGNQKAIESAFRMAERGDILARSSVLRIIEEYS